MASMTSCTRVIFRAPITDRTEQPDSCVAGLLQCCPPVSNCGRSFVGSDYGIVDNAAGTSRGRDPPAGQTGVPGGAATQSPSPGDNGPVRSAPKPRAVPATYP